KRITPLRPANYYRVTLERRGKMVMPVDLDFLIRPQSPASKNKKAIAASDVFYSITIPVTQYQKPGRYNLKPWIGWDKLRPTYTFDIEMPVAGELKQVWLDRSGRLADIYRVNNVWKRLEKTQRMATRPRQRRKHQLLGRLPMAHPTRFAFQRRFRLHARPTTFWSIRGQKTPISPRPVVAPRYPGPTNIACPKRELPHLLQTPNPRRWHVLLRIVPIQ
ncbi:MAG: hypothetical protein RLZZ47_692, partial [Bacteroidota bacterium]